MRHRIANTLELLSSSLIMETIARQRSHHPRRAFHSISHVARVWFLGGLVFCRITCRIAVAVVVVCVEPRGPASPIGVLDIQMTAVMRREFGTAEPPSSEVELGRGRANDLAHVYCLPTGARLKASEAFFSSLSFQGHVKVKLVKNSRRVRQG